MARGQDRAYSVLRQRLVGGHYRPGFHLREEPLAQELGLSRTPVRAALKRLVEDGLATADAGQGIHVAEWSEADIEETFRIRMLLEPYATELAVRRGGDPLVERLEASNQTMAAAIARGDDQAIAVIQATNRDFHQTLLAFAGAPRLRSMLDALIDMPIVVRSFFLYSPAERAYHGSVWWRVGSACGSRLRDERSALNGWDRATGRDRRDGHGATPAGPA